MKEVKEHKAYELLNGKYGRVCLDYVILYSDEEYIGMESHKKAVTEAFHVLNERFASCEINFDLSPDKMLGEKINLSDFLFSPSSEDNKAEKSGSNNAYIPYWRAFLKPPHGTPYHISDFVDFNGILFPNKDTVEVYQWNNDFSNYFDEGKEWWGTGFWTAYDLKTDIAVVIGASLTD